MVMSAASRCWIVLWITLITLLVWLLLLDLQISFTLLLRRAKFEYKNWKKITQAVPNFIKYDYFRSSHLKCSVKKMFLEIS